MKIKPIPAQRENLILEILETKQFIRSTELCFLLNISESTARRENMENRGLLDRVHGGAIISQQILTDPSYHQSKGTNFEQKEAIGNKVVSMLEPNDLIFLNHGTTTEIIAEKIKQSSNITNLTVVTSNYNIVNILKDSPVNTICIGGVFRVASQSFVGSIALENIDKFSASKCFIGVDGINMKYGCTVTAEQDAEISRHMIKQTYGKVTIVADHKKWGIVSPYVCTTLERVNQLITDKELNHEILKMINEFNVEVICV